MDIGSMVNMCMTMRRRGGDNGISVWKRNTGGCAYRRVYG